MKHLVKLLLTLCLLPTLAFAVSTCPQSDAGYRLMLASKPYYNSYDYRSGHYTTAINYYLNGTFKYHVTGSNSDVNAYFDVFGTWSVSKPLLYRHIQQVTDISYSKTGNNTIVKAMVGTAESIKSNSDPVSELPYCYT